MVNNKLIVLILSLFLVLTLFFTLMLFGNLGFKNDYDKTDRDISGNRLVAINQGNMNLEENNNELRYVNEKLIQKNSKIEDGAAFETKNGEIYVLEGENALILNGYLINTQDTNLKFINLNE
jgi:cell division protein FtsB